MPKKPKARRGPVVKTDWVVKDESNDVTTHVYTTKQEALDAADVWRRFNPGVYERRWRKIK